MSSARFPYIQRGQPGDPAGLMPMLPIRVERDSRAFDVHALVDSGATMNTLPFSVGSQFGVDWDSLTQSVQLGGSSGPVPARLLALAGLVAGFPPVQLLFAWAQNDAYPIVLRQINFFFTFDVCFSRAQGYFELTHRP